MSSSKGAASGAADSKASSAAQTGGDSSSEKGAAGAGAGSADAAASAKDASQVIRCTICKRLFLCRAIQMACASCVCSSISSVCSVLPSGFRCAPCWLSQGSFRVVVVLLDLSTTHFSSARLTHVPGRNTGLASGDEGDVLVPHPILGVPICSSNCLVSFQKVCFRFGWWWLPWSQERHTHGQ